jgi:hypothetical protein
MEDISVSPSQLAYILLRQKFTWISVSERLPEELTTVLVYHPDAPFAPSGIDLASQMDGDSWMLSDGRLGQPTHWMPLPEPPAN